jgi:hypothetical protein
MQQQTPPATAAAGQDMRTVEAQMGQIVTDSGGAYRSAPAAGYGRSPEPDR